MSVNSKEVVGSPEATVTDDFESSNIDSGN